MNSETITINDYSIHLLATEIKPPIADIKYEAKMNLVYDHLNNRKLNHVSDLVYGETAEEALKKAKINAINWANEQR